LPVICTRWGALEELVDASCGRLVSPGDPFGLRAAIDELAGDRELRERLAASALRRASAYDATVWSRWFVDRCRELVTPGRS
jgi:glycosyltransferase involved in cell wall biosynthesis